MSGNSELNKPTDILFVGEAPGQSEYAIGTPFVGPAGQELNELVEESLDPSLRYVITNAILCTPFSDESRSNIRTPSVPEIAACRTHLQRLIGILRPRHVIALGKVAERSLKKFMPERSINSDSLSFTTIIHPSAILRSTHQDLERTRAILSLKAISDKLCE